MHTTCACQCHVLLLAATGQILTYTAAVLRDLQVAATAIGPRVRVLSGTSEQVVRQWQEQVISMLPGDVVTLKVSDGPLKLWEPLRVPGVVVRPAALPHTPEPWSGGRPASRLPLGVTPATGSGSWNSSTTQGRSSNATSSYQVSGVRPTRPRLRITCSGNSTAFRIV